MSQGSTRKLHNQNPNVRHTENLQNGLRICWGQCFAGFILCTIKEFLCGKDITSVLFCMDTDVLCCGGLPAQVPSQFNCDYPARSFVEVTRRRKRWESLVCSRDTVDWMSFILERKTVLQRSHSAFYTTSAPTLNGQKVHCENTFLLFYMVVHMILFHMSHDRKTPMRN